MNLTKSIIVLFLFNLTIGNYILFTLESYKSPVSERYLLHLCFSIAAIPLLIYLVGQFKKRGNYFVLILINFFIAFTIPFCGAFFSCIGIMFSDGDFSKLINAIVFSLFAGMVSFPFWSGMGLINLIILVVYKRSLTSKRFR